MSDCNNPRIRLECDCRDWNEKTKTLIDAMGEFEPDMNSPRIRVLVGTPSDPEELYIRQMKLKEPQP